MATCFGAILGSAAPRATWGSGLLTLERRAGRSAPALADGAARFGDVAGAAESAGGASRCLTTSTTEEISTSDESCFARAAGAGRAERLRLGFSAATSVVVAAAGAVAAGGDSIATSASGSSRVDQKKNATAATASPPIATAPIFNPRRSGAGGGRWATTCSSRERSASALFSSSKRWSALRIVLTRIPNSSPRPQLRLRTFRPATKVPRSPLQTAVRLRRRAARETRARPARGSCSRTQTS